MVLLTRVFPMQQPSVINVVLVFDLKAAFSRFQIR